MVKPTTLKVIPDIGAFSYLTRISIVADCPMSFYYYPADTQDCAFSVRSFSYTKNDLVLHWFKTGVWLNELDTSNFDVKVGNLRNYTKIEDDEGSLLLFFSSTPYVLLLMRCFKIFLNTNRSLVRVF